MSKKAPWAVLPLDLSFKEIATVNDVVKLRPRKNRLGGVPKCDDDHKFITRSVWLSNNNIQTTRDATAILEVYFATIANLVWLDLSYNKIYDIDESILQLKQLKILYLHSNIIHNVEVVALLRQLPDLQTLTLQGNPVSSLPQYRATVLHLVPQLTSLDFVRVVLSERSGLPPQCHQDIVRKKIVKK